jgi:hypothetical protein
LIFIYAAYADIFISFHLRHHAHAIAFAADAIAITFSLPPAAISPPPFT